MKNILKATIASLVIAVASACSDAPDTGLDTQFEDVRSAVVQLQAGAGELSGVVIQVVGMPVFEPESMDERIRLITQPSAEGLTIAVLATESLPRQLFGWTLAEGAVIGDYTIRVVEAVDLNNLPVPESLLPSASVR
jgi:hypothetical protein